MSITTAPAGSPPAPVGQTGMPPLAPGQLDTPRPRTSGAMWLGILAILVFFGGFLLWSALAPLAEAAIAPGQIRSEGSRRTIQHLEGGIVREILARDGDKVKAGQVLMRLDDAQSAASLEMLRGQHWALMAQFARLEAERHGASEITFPQKLLEAGDPRSLEAMTGQRTLFAARQASLISQIQVLEARIAQHEATASSARAQIGSQQRQLELIKREEQDVRTLVAQGLERMPRLLALQRNVASLEGNMQDLIGQTERAAAAAAEARSQMQQVRDQRLADVSTESREVRSRLNETEEKLGAAQDVVTRREIVAPEDGTILGSRFFNLGAVVKPGEPVMELVPSRDRLVAEVELSPTDIDVVYPGLEAEVRLPAFKQRLVPFLHGHVTYVASDVTVDERTRASHYRVQIVVDEDQLAKLENVALRAGMPVEAQIQTGSRSFLRYMIQPVLDSFHRAFREQ
ncbi:HlyD family type I secretion periplasmic adaptor subunit [Roseomonas marmotae]|uniref:Membrane fusion protein (MFP) family protein n=1 Tax=Roseomonas marmotae TaxID=2768161 RepID=A0ABS3KAL4_9PROT|nr:HlyD family type I secretion periplasmic adaptor subunit [Roseomonas marmotae]MBO1074487.1 HlyD family type I secretion periplasmic adaptor subunit [Roseomonas marmotae]QTI78219.1 HlyD family type I secretion periplasmic adaptor subunit [Roseomonas marmotae]